MGNHPRLLASFASAWLALLVAGLMAGCRPAEPSSSSAEAGAGRDLLADVGPVGTTANDLGFEAMRWEDVQPTAEGAASDPEVRAWALELTSTAPAAPVRYLRGLLFLAAGNPNAAMDAFSRLAPDEIPALYLYAPYRLYGELHPRTPNPYLPLLRQALAASRVPAMIEARVRAQEGDLKQSLAAYLRSDPALWAVYDLNVFRAMLQHAGLANEAGIFLRGALEGGRVESPLRVELLTMLNPTNREVAQDLVHDRLQSYLATNSQGRALAIAATQRQLALRQRFVQKDYRGLLDDYRLEDPVALPNETVLLLFLAAAQERDLAAVDRWSQEVKRRVPTEEVEQWVHQITTEAK